MSYRLQNDCSDISWEDVAGTLRSAGMASYDQALHRKAFENSALVVFVFDGMRMIGFGRALTDHAYQAVLYDVVVIPEYQGKGVGKLIFEGISSRLKGCNIMLYAAPGREGFYERFGMRKMITAMALFTDGERMKRKGFTE
ncbi:MAG: GNAT family N-acetyltransferase [Deltaproteobacteria bacterium]|nr:GNAT family N-acetyltransferase [Deltaproteobacteria bacterium]MBN2687651.1 GNAT family N-acetyltransferase [Deltaproteobacteria bacterium]